MVKKTIIAVALIVLLAVVFVGAYHYRGYTRYGASYYYPLYSPYDYPAYDIPYYGSDYSYRPTVSYPSYGGEYLYGPSRAYPYYSYPYYGATIYNPSPLSTGSLYTRGLPGSINVPSDAPQVAYPYYAKGGNSQAGQFCGIINGRPMGCQSGLVCDYNKATEKSLGVCTTASTAKLTKASWEGNTQFYPQR